MINFLDLLKNVIEGNVNVQNIEQGVQLIEKLIALCESMNDVQQSAGQSQLPPKQSGS